MTEIEIRKQLVETAITYLGCKKSNGTHKKIIDLYNTYRPLPRGYKMDYNDHWCAAYISSMAIKCGHTDIMPVECSCSRMITLYKNLGRWMETDSYVPSPADLVMYDWDDTKNYAITDNKGAPEHVGLVVSVTGKKIKVIEGNYNNEVKYRTLDVNGRYIRGFCIPNFASKATSEDPIPENGKKPVTADIVKAVINGDYKNGSTRRKLLEADGYDPDEVQAAVNAQLYGKNELKVNNFVRLKRGAKSYTGQRLASFVYGWDMKVEEIKGDRVVISHGGTIIAAVKKDDLTVI